MRKQMGVSQNYFQRVIERDPSGTLFEKLSKTGKELSEVIFKLSSQTALKGRVSGGNASASGDTHQIPQNLNPKSTDRGLGCRGPTPLFEVRKGMLSHFQD